MNNRHSRLLAYVTAHGKTKVDDLAEYLDTSKVTIRKDLNYLANRGALKRARGYAVPNDPTDINYRLAFNYEKKQRIAKVAATFIQDGESILIESGSTCALFAEELAKTKTNITIITNSIYIANFIKEYDNIQLILLGGTLQNDSQALVGPLTKQAVHSFHVDKIFTGADGYSREYGFTADDMIRLDTVQEMAKRAMHTYVLTVSEKFHQPGAVNFLDLDHVDYVITDSDIPMDEKEYLEQHHIQVTLANPA